MDSFVWSLLALFCCSAANSFPVQADLQAAADWQGLISLEEKLPSSLPTYSRKLLLIDRQGQLLWTAAINGEYSEVERLIEAGADPNYVTEEGSSVLGAAIAKNQGRIVALLISKGVAPGGPPGSTVAKHGALQLAAKDGATSAVTVLLEAGVSVNGLSADGLSALHIAAGYGFTDVAELLLDNGATINLLSEGKFGYTALHFAALSSYYGVATLLVSRGADVNAPMAKYAETPLHSAAMTNSPLLIQFLIDNGAHIDARASTGQTPLWRATYNGNRNAIEVLLLNGVDKSIKALGLTPREALCQCTFEDEVYDLCQVDACKNPTRMQQFFV